MNVYCFYYVLQLFKLILSKLGHNISEARNVKWKENQGKFSRGRQTIQVDTV